MDHKLESLQMITIDDRNPLFLGIKLHLLLFFYYFAKYYYIPSYFVIILVFYSIYVKVK